MLDELTRGPWHVARAIGAKHGQDKNKYQESGYAEQRPHKELQEQFAVLLCVVLRLLRCHLFTHSGKECITWLAA